MGFQADYDIAERFLFYGTERKNARGNTIYDFSTRFCMLNVAGVSYYETLPILLMSTDDVGTALGVAVEQGTVLQNIEIDTKKTYNSDKDTPVFELHPFV